MTLSTPPTTHSAPSADLFDLISHPQVLRAAWKTVRRNKGAPGGDGQSITDFGADLSREIPVLVEELHAGRYRPRPLRSVRIPKKSGGQRELRIPAVRDRVVQSAAARLLERRLASWMSPASFAYRPKLSRAHAAGQITTWRLFGFDWIAESDIADFFGTLPHPVLRAAMREAIGDAPRLEALIELWLTSFATGPSGMRGIAQGSPISPLLANLALTPVDRAIHSRRVKLVRYADDFVLLTRNEAAARSSLEKMAALLAERGMILNAEKTRLSRFGFGLSFLGYTFLDHGVWPEKP
ncbi:MAG: reverse transcriptase domain-containing protein [Neomegalonema sp.]|nr:reverse transcriptase domain-containing protein [Neomegalonema sp.]